MCAYLVCKGSFGRGEELERNTVFAYRGVVLGGTLAV